MCHKMPQATEAEVIAVGLLENMLSGVKTRHRQTFGAVRAERSKADVVQTRKSHLATIGVVVPRIENRKLQRAVSMIALVPCHDHVFRLVDRVSVPTLERYQSLEECTSEV